MIESKDITHYYKSIFALKSVGNFSLLEIEEMFPYELEIFSALTIESLERQKQELKNGK